MKTVHTILLGAFLLLTAATVSAQSLEIEVTGIRNAKGSILLMVQGEGLKEPIYKMEAAREGKLLLAVDSPKIATVEISLFHDENGNYQMDKDEAGMPAEGFGGKRCKLNAETTKVRIPLTYLKEE